MSSRYPWTEKNVNSLMTFLDTHHELFSNDRNEGYIAAAECLNRLAAQPLKHVKCNDLKVQCKLQALHRHEALAFRKEIDFPLWLSHTRYRTGNWRAANIGSCTRENKVSDFSSEERVNKKSDKGNVAMEPTSGQDFPVASQAQSYIAPLTRRHAFLQSLEKAPLQEISVDLRSSFQTVGLPLKPLMKDSKSQMKQERLQDRGLDDKSIAESLSAIGQLIIDIVGTLGNILVLDEYSWIQVSDADIWFKELYELFSLGLGLEDGQTLDVALRRLKVDMKNIRLYLRMLIGVAVYKDVFTSSFPNFPIPSRKWARQLAEETSRLLGNECPKKMEIIAQSAIGVLSDSEEFRNFTLPNQAETLAYGLLEHLSPLLTCFKSTSIDRDPKGRTAILWTSCGGLLTDVFIAALELRTEMNLKESSYTFFWPRASAIYDGNTMDREEFQTRIESSRADLQEEKVVTMTLLPGIRRISVSPIRRPLKESRNNRTGNKAPHETNKEGKVILPALVQLRNP